MFRIQTEHALQYLALHRRDLDEMRLSPANRREGIDRDHHKDLQPKIVYSIVGADTYSTLSCLWRWAVEYHN